MNLLVRVSLSGVILALASGAADKPKFTVEPAPSYPNRQTIDGVTVAADVFDTAEKARTAFGKANPYQHGVLPVLVVMRNDTAKALSLTGIQLEYISPDRTKIEPTPASDVPYITGNRQRKVVQNPLPTGIPGIKGKNPLGASEIQERAFVAKMLPPGESAHGFVYFQTVHRSGSRLFLRGLTEAASKRELFYYEIELPEAAR